WRVAAVPQPADDVGATRVASLEDDEHFVVHVWNEPAPAVVAAHQRRNPRPRVVAFAARVGRPRQRDLDASLSLRVFNVADERRVDAVPATAESARHALVNERFDWIV